MPDIIWMVPIVLVVAVISNWWNTRRFKKLQMLANEYGLTLNIYVPKFLGIYIWTPFFWGKVDSLQGKIGTHQIEIYDWYRFSKNNMLKTNATSFLSKSSTPPRGTTVEVDGEPIKFGVNSLTLGGSMMLARISEIKDLLEKFKNEAGS